MKKFIKLSIYGVNKIIIENYLNIKDIFEDKIIIDEYEINGRLLKIIRMDRNMIEVNGSINNVNIIGINNDDK